MRLPARLARLARRHAGSQSGTSTVEFVLWVPFMLLFLASMTESATFMMRWMLLDRAVDVAVRDLRLSTFSPPSFEEFRQAICDEAQLPDCLGSLQVELVPVASGEWTALSSTPACIDRETTIDPVSETTYTPGVANQIVAVRACALMEPLFANIGIGALMPKDANGEFRVISYSAYAQEP